MTMSENEQDIAAQIRFWAWSGYYGLEMASEMLEDQLSEAWGDVDAEKMRRSLAEAFREKADAEARWPAETDCDRLDRAFAQLEKLGICAVQNAGYTQSDGHAEVAHALEELGRKRFHGYCFFHGQDLERAISGSGLLLAFGDLGADPAKTVQVGQKIVSVLAAEGFTTTWDGKDTSRIDVRIDWKRRMS
jgi:hypothetical protein